MLLNYPEASSWSFPQSVVMKHMIEIGEALRYIHGKDIIHRDIKSPNILIAENGQAKLGDFGLSVQAKKLNTKKYSIVGTDCYYSPEMHKNKVIQKGKPNDIWAFGLILVEMMMGTPLWELDIDFGIRSIEDPNFISDFICTRIPPKYDKDLKSLLKKMLNPQPELRINIEELMKKKLIRQQQSKLRLELNKEKKRSFKLQRRISSFSSEEAQSEKEQVKEIKRIIN